MDLNERVVLITGSTGELGTAVTQLFLTAQAKVIGLGSRESTLAELKSKLGNDRSRFHGSVVDVLDQSNLESAVKNFVDEHKRIDVLINLVGGFLGGVSAHETTEEQWDKMMDINAKSAFLCCRTVLPIMLKQESGRIINIAGRSGMQATAGMVAYSASKATVINLTKTISVEGRDRNVTANVVIPSIMDTAPNRKAMKDADFDKWVTPQTVAEVILFLCSAAAQEISGAVIPVYGKS